jgi:GntR family transcriptional regulator
LYRRSAPSAGPPCKQAPAPLRDEGLLEFRRGRGISIARSPAQGAVVQQARELVAFARRHGYRVDELIEIIKDVS